MDEDLIMDISVRAVLWVVFIATGFQFYYLHGIFTRLEQKYPTLWEEFGRPSFFYNSNQRSTKNIYVYLSDKEWMKSGDPVLISKARKALYCLYVATSLAAFMGATAGLGAICIYLL